MSDSGSDPLAAQVLMEEQQVTMLMREMHEEDGACGRAAVRGFAVRRCTRHAAPRQPSRMRGDGRSE